MFDTLTRVGASAAGAYKIDRSLRFNRPDSANLTRTSSATSSTWTYSGWVKRSHFAQYQYLFSSGTEGFAFHATDETFYIYSSVNSTLVKSAGSFRDPSAWYHVVVQMNSGTANAWINNVQTHTNAGGFALSTGSNETRIGSHASNNHHFDGYMADIHFVDGQTLTPSSFGETDEDTGQWIPKKYTGAHGTDGFYLDFSDNSAATATTLGKDKAGSNNFTPNNLSVSAGDGNDSRTDTPTNNMCTMNPLWHKSITTFSEGALHMGGSSGLNEISTIGLPGTSSFYYEVVWSTMPGWNTAGVIEGLASTGGDISSFTHLLYDSKITAWHSTLASVQQGSYDASNGIQWTTNDVIGIKYVNGTLTIYKNGTAHGTTLSVSSNTSTIYPQIQSDGGSVAAYIRFSSSEWTETPSGVDADWEVDPDRLPDPVIKKPTDYFDTSLWSGNGGTQNITGLSFQPDLVWNKCRSTTHDHQWWDSVRGVTKSIRQDNEVEATHTDGLTAFNSDGYTWGANARNNGSGETYVGWAWKESATAGFDIISYEGNVTNRTISHSLGVTPQFFTTKNLENNSPGNWFGWVLTLDNDDTITLDRQNAIQSVNIFLWNNTLPSSSAISLGESGWANGDGEDYIGYLWTSVEGFSKIGTYKGNGNADGPFIYTGFKPAFLLCKKLSGDDNWEVYDNKRVTYNPVGKSLTPNTNASEATSRDVDFLSNGFKQRNTNGNTNENTYTYMYMAFAESPYKYATAR